MTNTPISPTPVPAPVCAPAPASASTLGRARASFFNLYHHDFVRVAVAMPLLQLADPVTNANRTIELLHQAHQRHAAIVLFPELGLTGYSCEDLFHQQALLEVARSELERIAAATHDLPLLAAVGLPLLHQGALYNVAALLCRGRILGLVPKSHLPNYREFYEGRQFRPGPLTTELVQFGSQSAAVPLGTRLLFQDGQQPLLRLGVELCEDLWVPLPPSTHAALAGASVILNLSASNATVGKAAYRRQLVSTQSARCLCAYLYSAAGVGESTTDLAWDGQGMIADHGAIIAESERFASHPQVLVADLDLLRLSQERLRLNTFQDNRLRQPPQAEWQVIPFDLGLEHTEKLPLLQAPSRLPFVPESGPERTERCAEIFAIQTQGLASRLRASGMKRLVLGVSGGLDSAHALLVSRAALAQLGHPPENLLAYTLPGFATSAHTLELAHRLITGLGLKPRQIDIRPSCQQMFKDIEHPFAAGTPLYDVTFENVQAGERTSHLFRLANLHQALVVGTSDLSELALGWSTYGVGDHMAHYHVNAGVPKTLIQHLISWSQEISELSAEAHAALARVLANEITPELIPVTATAEIQRSEDTVGPYALQDFYLHHLLRFGFSPYRVGFMAWCAWSRNQESHAAARYDLATLRHWLGVFVIRFFANSQFKRSCLANGPKVGSSALSPRGDWRAPSDSSATLWQEAVDRIPQEDRQGAAEPSQLEDGRRLAADRTPQKCRMKQ